MDVDIDVDMDVDMDMEVDTDVDMDVNVEVDMDVAVAVDVDVDVDADVARSVAPIRLGHVRAEWAGADEQLCAEELPLAQAPWSAPPSWPPPCP